jgi:hypothetical protein
MANIVNVQADLSPLLQLHTAQVSLTSEENLKVLKSIATCWYELADVRIEEAYHLKNLIAVDRLQTAQNLLLSIECLCSKEQKRKPEDILQNDICHVAYSPEKMCLEGILICSQDAQITHLVTHPKNISILPTDKKVRGVGTALIRHLSQNLENAKAEKNRCIKLLPSRSAYDFYKKLGFGPEACPNSSFSWYTLWMLDDKNRKQLIEKYQNIAIADKDPITLSKFI